MLPGIDDGPATIEGSLAIARLAAAGGTRVLVATPHVNWRYHNDAATIAERVAELNARLASEEVLTTDGHPVEVRPGAEIALTQIAELDDAQLACLGLGGGPWLLVEPPFTPVAPHLDEMLLALLSGERRVVLAHPERCPAFQRDRSMLERLVGAGVITSVTAGSFGGQFGSEARRLAFALAHERAPPQRRLRYPRHRQPRSRDSRATRASRTCPIGAVADLGGARRGPRGRADPARPGDGASVGGARRTPRRWWPPCIADRAPPARRWPSVPRRPTASRPATIPAPPTPRRVQRRSRCR